MQKVREENNMLQSSTTLIETATVAGATGLTAKTAVKIEKDEAGNATGILVNKKKAAIGATLSTTASSGTYMFQEASYQNTLREINSAQAYVESLSDEELERTLIALDQLDPEVISQEAKTINK
jgi:hypothetical protein